MRRLPVQIMLLSGDPLTFRDVAFALSLGGFLPQGGRCSPECE